MVGPYRRTRKRTSLENVRNLPSVLIPVQKSHQENNIHGHCFRLFLVGFEISIYIQGGMHVQTLITPDSDIFYPFKNQDATLTEGRMLL